MRESRQAWFTQAAALSVRACKPWHISRIKSLVVKTSSCAAEGAEGVEDAEEDEEVEEDDEKDVEEQEENDEEDEDDEGLCDCSMVVVGLTLLCFSVFCCCYCS